MSYQPFIILSPPRSGTHMLRSALLAHSNIVVHHELFSPYPGESHPYSLNEPLESILKNYAFRNFHSQITAVGFPINEHHCNKENSPQWAGIWAELANTDELKVIRLRRKNLLRAFVSRMTATKTHQWNLYPNSTRHHEGNIGVNVDAKTLEAIFIKNTRRYEYFNKLFGESPKVDVAYEDMCADFSNEYTRVQEF